jgi:glycosyltransferase involved in cell wall biosynthesis
MSSSDSIQLSIIIPAYNEESRLAESLSEVAEFVHNHSAQMEVIVVNNNSSDRTLEIAEDFAARYPFFRALTERRQGKGIAVQTGMQAGRGEYLIFCDADFSMPVEEIEKFLPGSIGKYDIAIGSREGPGSIRIDEPQYRHIMGRVFNFIVRVMAIPGVQDTQCGFKAFRRDVVQEVFPLQTIHGWGFDVEVLFIALKKGYRLVEIPVTWRYFPNSRVSPIRDSIRTFADVIQIRWNSLMGKYNGRAAE